MSRRSAFASGLVVAAAAMLWLLRPAPREPERFARFGVNTTSQARLEGSLSVAAEFRGELAVEYTGPTSARVLVTRVAAGWVEAGSGNEADRSRIPVEGLLGRSAEVDLETGAFSLGRSSGPELSTEAAELLRTLALQVPPWARSPKDGPTASPVGVVNARYVKSEDGWVRRAESAVAWAGDPNPPHAADRLEERWELRAARGTRAFMGEANLEREVIGRPLVLAVRWTWEELDGETAPLPLTMWDDKRPISGPARPLPADQVALAKRNATREASGGIDLPRVLSGLKGMVGPMQASDDRFLWRAAAYFELHPEELPALLPLFAEQVEAGRNPGAILWLLAAVGSPEAQQVFWDALGAHGTAVRGEVLGEWLTVASTFRAPSEGTMSALQPYLEHASALVRERSTLALGAAAGFAYGSEAATQAVEELERRWTSAETRAEKELAVTALGNAAHPSSLPLIEEAARSEEWAVRARAARALVKYPAETAQPSLVRLLGDTDHGVREKTHVALDEHLAQGAPLLPGTEQAVLERARAGLDTGAMAAAVRVLARSSSPDARAALEAIARSPAASPGLRAEIRRALTRG